MKREEIMQKGKIIKLCKLESGNRNKSVVCKTKWISGKTLKNQREMSVENPVENVDNI